MKRKVLCFALALLMCMMVALPTLADSYEETPSERANITTAFGLKLVSGSTYKMWAKITNPQGASVSVALTLYNASYTPVASVNTTSSNTSISISKTVTLSSGTYYLRLTCMVDGSSYSSEKTYTI